MGEIRVRLATPADLPALRDLWRQLEALQDPYRRLARAPQADDLAVAGFLEAMGDPVARVLVAVAPDDRVVGMAIADAWSQAPLNRDSVVELRRVVVDRDHRGRGAGRALVAAAEAFARERGAGYLAATMYSGNADARRFWGRIGFGSWTETYLRPVDAPAAGSQAASPGIPDTRPRDRAT